MTDLKVERVSARKGYDLWAETYDETPNPVVHMDSRHSVTLLAPQRGERILDAGCGTGRNFARIVDAGSQLVGIDFSLGMLQVANRRHADVPLALVNLEQPLPFARASFDAVLCALIGEHLQDLRAVLAGFHAVLKRGGRLVFSVYHPAMAEAGKEAHFQRAGVEYRLGAYRHRVADYRDMLAVVGFVRVEQHEFRGDAPLVQAVPQAARLLDFPVLLIFDAEAQG